MNRPDVRCVLLADRHAVLTEGVRGLLDTMFDAVVMVADVASLLETAGRLQPTVSVADISLGGSSNLGWVGQLRERCPETRLVLLSVHDQDLVHRAARAAGADAVVLKREIATHLLPTLEQMLDEAGRPQLPSHSDPMTPGSR